MRIAGRIITVFAAIVAVVIAPFLFGFSLYGEAELSYSGKGDATLTIESETEERDFRTRLDTAVNGYNLVSGDSDMIKVKDVSPCEGGYRVKVGFRRIDKIGGMGDFAYSSVAEYVSEGSLTGQLLENWESGNLRCSVSVVYDGLTGMVEIPRGTNVLKISPSTFSGENVDFEDFISKSRYADDNVKIFRFRLLDVGDVTSITLTFAGKIAYVAGNDLTVTDDNSIVIKPSTVAANITKYKIIQNADGSYSDRVEYFPDEDIGVMMGYVVFEQGLSPVAIGFIVAVAIIVLLFSVLLIAWLHRTGKSADTNRKKSLSSVAVKSTSDANTTDVEASVRASPKTISDTTSECANEKRTKARASSAFLSSVGDGIKVFFNGRTWKNIVQHKALYLLILPAVVLIAVFCYGSMFGLVIAFQDFKLLEGIGGSEWVGLKYFSSILFADAEGTYRVFRNTIYISIIRIVTNFPLILIFTLLLNEIQNRKIKGLVQTVSYIPYFISWIAVSGMAYNILSVDGGLLNKILALFGREAVVWYSEDNSSWWWILAISSLWKTMGWSTLIYISALGTINDELYDACTIDGGGRFRKAVSVTLPGIMNVIMLQLILDVASVMRDNYEQVLAMVNNSQALGKYTTIIGSLSFGAITSGGGLAKPTAYGMIQGVIGLVLVLIANWVTKKTDNEGIL